MLKLLGGLASLVLAVVVALMLLVSILSVQLAGTASQGGSCLSSTTGTGGCSGNGASVATAALAMAQHLSGNPDAWYDTGMPQAVLTFWSQSCPSGSGCWIDWQEGSLQCVLFVTGAFALAGSPLPVVGNAIDFWSLYQNRPGWVEIPSAAAPPTQRSLPMPGDIMVWYNPPPLVGHVAIVVGVNPPTGGHNGSVTFAEANGPGALVTEPLLPDLSVVTWSDPIPYTVLGYIRSLTPIGANASQHLVRVSQLDSGQYGSAAEYTTWVYSACSAAAMTEVLNAYRRHYRIHDILTLEAERGDITPTLGLTSLGGIADTVAHFGFHTSWGFSLPLDQVIARAQQGAPVIVDFPPDRYAGGHILVVTGGTADTVSVADSSEHNYTVLSRGQFLQWWGGFSAIVRPSSG
jgi:CHAP domain/Peptidase C39 family